MKVKLLILLLLSHVFVGALGFAFGIYSLPILTAPDAPTQAEVQQHYPEVRYFAEFTPELTDSDALHWGEGKLALGDEYISLAGELAPGPDYKLYLSPEFVETEADFKRLKSNMRAIADINTFNNFLVPVPADVKLDDYTSVIIWCESFGEFITAAKYR